MILRHRSVGAIRLTVSRDCCPSTGHVRNCRTAIDQVAAARCPTAVQEFIPHHKFRLAIRIRTAMVTLLAGMQCRAPGSRAISTRCAVGGLAGQTCDETDTEFETELRLQDRDCNARFSLGRRHQRNGSPPDANWLAPRLRKRTAAIFQWLGETAGPMQISIGQDVLSLP